MKTYVINNHTYNWTPLFEENHDPRNSCWYKWYEKMNNTFKEDKSDPFCDSNMRN